MLVYESVGAIDQSDAPKQSSGVGYVRCTFAG